jgi:hypothetical protein
MKTKRSTECAVLMGLGACHGCASGSNLAFHLDFRPQIHRARIFCGGQPTAKLPNAIGVFGEETSMATDPVPVMLFVKLERNPTRADEVE